MKKQSSSKKRNVVSGGTGGGFIGFSAFAGSTTSSATESTSNVVGSSTTDNASVNTSSGGGGKQTPNPVYVGNRPLLRATFAKLRKKDPITKVKALTALVSSEDEDGIFNTNMSTSASKQDVIVALTHYTFLFHNTTPVSNRMYPHNGCLVYDNTASVRVAAYQIWWNSIQLIPKATKNLLLFSSPEQMNALGSIYTCCFDSNRETSSKADEMFDSIETTLFANCKKELRQAIWSHLVSIMSQVKPPSVAKSGLEDDNKEEETSYMKERYDRVILSTLEALVNILQRYPEQEDSSYIQYLSDNPKCLFKHIANPQEPLFRHATYRLMSSCIQYAPSLISVSDNSKSKQSQPSSRYMVSTLLMTALSFEKHPNNPNVLLESIVLYIRYLKQQEASQKEDDEYHVVCDQMMKPLMNKQLRKLCHGCPPRLWCPLLLPLLVALPNDGKVKLVQSVWDGMIHPHDGSGGGSGGSYHGDGISIVTAISECCTYLIKTKKSSSSSLDVLDLFYQGLQWYLESCPFSVALEQRTKQLATRLSHDWMTILVTSSMDDDTTHSSNMEQRTTKLFKDVCQSIFHLLEQKEAGSNRQQQQQQQQTQFECKLVIWLTCLQTATPAATNSSSSSPSALLQRGLQIVFYFIRQSRIPSCLPTLEDMECLLDIYQFCGEGKEFRNYLFQAPSIDETEQSTLVKDFHHLSFKEEEHDKEVEVFVMNDLLKWTIVLGRTSSSSLVHDHEHRREESLQKCFSLLYHVLFSDVNEDNAQKRLWEAFIRECIQSKCHLGTITIALQTAMLHFQTKNQSESLSSNEKITPSKFLQCATLNQFAIEVGTAAEDIYLIHCRKMIETTAEAAAAAASGTDDHDKGDVIPTTTTTETALDSSTSEVVTVMDQHHLNELDQFLRACCGLGSHIGSKQGKKQQNNGGCFVGTNVIDQWIMKCCTKRRVLTSEDNDDHENDGTFFSSKDDVSLLTSTQRQHESEGSDVLFHVLIDMAPTLEQPNAKQQIWLEGWFRGGSSWEHIVRTNAFSKNMTLFGCIVDDARPWLCGDLNLLLNDNEAAVEEVSSVSSSLRWATRALRLIHLYRETQEELEDEENDCCKDIPVFDSLLDLIGLYEPIRKNDHHLITPKRAHHVSSRLLTLLELIPDAFERRCLLLMSPHGPSFDLDHKEAQKFFISVIKVCFQSVSVGSILSSRIDLLKQRYSIGHYLLDLLLGTTTKQDDHTDNSKEEWLTNRFMEWMEQCCLNVIEQLSLNANQAQRQTDDNANDDDAASQLLSLDIQVLDFFMERLALASSTKQRREREREQHPSSSSSPILLPEEVVDPFTIQTGDELLYIVKQTQGGGDDKPTSEQEDFHSLVPVTITKVHVEDLPNEPYFTIQGQGLTSGGGSSNTIEERQTVASRLRRKGGTEQQAATITYILDPKMALRLEEVIVQTIVKPAFNRYVSNNINIYDSCSSSLLMETLYIVLTKCGGLQQSSTQKKGIGSVRHEVFRILTTLESRILSNVQCILHEYDTMIQKEEEQRKKEEARANLALENNKNKIADVSSMVTKKPSKAVVSSVLLNDKDNRLDDKYQCIHSDLTLLCRMLGGGTNTATITTTDILNEYDRTSLTDALVRLFNHPIVRQCAVAATTNCSTPESPMSWLLIKNLMVTSSRWFAITSPISLLSRDNSANTMSMVLTTIMKGIFSPTIDMKSDHHDDEQQEQMMLLEVFQYMCRTITVVLLLQVQSSSSSSNEGVVDVVELPNITWMMTRFLQMAHKHANDIGSTCSRLMYNSGTCEGTVGHDYLHHRTTTTMKKKDHMNESLLEWQEILLYLLMIVVQQQEQQNDKVVSLLFLLSLEEKNETTQNEDAETSAAEVTSANDNNDFMEQLIQSLFDSQTRWFAYQILTLIICHRDNDTSTFTTTTSSSDATETFAICQEALKEWSVGLPEEEMEELEEDIEIVVQLFPSTLIKQLLTWYTKSEEEEEPSEEVHHIGQFLCWMTVLDWLTSFDSTTAEEEEEEDGETLTTNARKKGAVISFLQQTKAGRYILSLAFEYMPWKKKVSSGSSNRTSSRKGLGGDSNAVQQYKWMLCMDIAENNKDDIHHLNIEHLATLIMYRTMQSLPTLAKLWWTDDCGVGVGVGVAASGTGGRGRTSSFSSSASASLSTSSVSPRKRTTGGGRGSAKEYIQQFVQHVVAPVTLKHELDQLQSTRLLDGMEVTGNLAAREVVAIYEQDEMKLSVVIRLPLAFPLRNVEVDCQKTLGIPERRWRRWALLIMRMLNHQDGSIVEALKMWKDNIDKEFDGVEPCPVCYSIICVKTHTMPNLECRTCSNRFHSSCLYKWFHSSGKNICVMCQQTWNGTKVRY